jgi:glycosyltransferase involved in cell wall biosynthesis
MKIAYVCYWFLFERDGVANKINAQVAYWREAGHDVDVFCLTRVFPSRQGERTEWRTFPFSSLPGRFRATAELVRGTRRWRPDLVYLRYDLFLPPLPRLLRAFPAAVEINSDDKQEAKLRVERASLAARYNELNRRTILSAVDGMVCVTNELARSPSFAAYEKPMIVIANGFDVDTVTPLPPSRAERPRIVFLGSARQAWHGVDKIIRLARALPAADFDLIGYERRHLAEAGLSELPANVVVHGILARADYEPVLAQADVGIGTLALHRKQMYEACPLKVREYLAYGLPVAIAYEDTDLDGVDAWWLLRLPNKESNVDEHVDDVRAFLASVRGRRVPRDEVAGRISTGAKEARRLEFLDRVRSGHASP